MVTYCGNTRRVSVGAKNGSLAVYDLKQNKCQVRYLSFTCVMQTGAFGCTRFSQLSVQFSLDRPALTWY